MLSILNLSTSLRPGSRSRQLLDLIDQRFAALGATTSFFDIADLPPALCDGRSLGAYPAEYGRLAEAMGAADGIVIAGAVYMYSAAGPTKNLLDICGSGLADKAFAIVSAAGSPRSHLALDSLATALANEFGAFPYPRTIQITADPADTPDFDQRLGTFADGFMSFVARLSESLVSSDALRVG